MTQKDEHSSDLLGQRQLRIEKAQKLREMGIDPYPSVARKTHTNAEISEDFDKLENKEVTVIGRLESWREHGGLIFGEIRDQSGSVQLYIRNDELAETKTEGENLGFADLGLVDIGDFILATGIVTKTQRGEISVQPRIIKMATKSIRPIPNEMLDKEERYRRRYVDMNVNPKVRGMFERRATFWQAHRDFLNSKGFFEVNIPILEHVPGGGDAVPFTTHMNAIHEDFFLRISHELPLKRLTGAGFDKVYDIGARFRNEGLSDEHLPEHIAMEFYWAYVNWDDGMKLVQDMFNYVIAKTYGGQTKFNIRGFEVDFSGEWERIDFNEVMNEHFDIGNVYEVELDKVIELLEQNNIDFDRTTITVPRGVDSLWKLIRKKIGGPAFLVNHPKYLSPLQKPSTDNPNIVERCQPIIAGSELGNGWSELNDPIEQYQRFVEQQEMRDAGDDEAQWLDIDYVEMLEYGMPPTFGWGHSERVFWFLEDVTAKEGVPFPAMKRHISETTKKIYTEIDLEQIQVEDKHEAKGVTENAHSPQPTAHSSAPHLPADKNHRLIIVLNQDLESWQLTNTVSHIAAYLGAQIGDIRLRTRDTFETKSGEIQANSQYPMISMRAKSSEQLYNLLEKVEEKGLIHLAFTKDMIEFNDDAELQEHYKDKNRKALEYLGVGFYGDNETLRELTKKFRLWS